MSTTPQKLMCLCYSGGERMANGDSSLGKYMSGVSEATVIEDRILFEESVIKVCSRMDMSHNGKSLFYCTSRDKSKHLRMRDADGVSMIFYLNEDAVDIFVEEETLANTPKQCNISSRLFKKAVILFAALNKFTLKYLDNSRHYYKLSCVVDGCPWKLTARAQSKFQLIRVIKMENEHCHTTQDNTNFKPRIRAKEMGCRPILFIDAYFLTGPHRGSCLSAVAYDANDQLYPLAYAIVSSENYEDWLWFMHNLKKIVAEKEVVVVTNRNPGLLRAVKELFGDKCNAWCVRHVKENFSKFAIGKGMKGNPKKMALHLFTKIAYACDERLYGVNLTKLFGLSPELSKWVEGMVHNTGQMHKMEASKWHPLPVGHNIDKMINESQEKSRGFTCRPSSPTEFIVSIFDWKSPAVKLHPFYCSCLRWQMKGIPCKHAIQYGCEDHDIATSSSTAMEALQPPATKRLAGRPKKKRIESQFQEKQTIFCGLYHEPGHNRSMCKSPLPG
ncbi:hypothetical protein RHSIM_Rhsim07G0149400 [Rhododendron simsii]|uniref:SWIM-type domain-containing protein n=1 Tax=Rhododendron simsii TaxID=118357 RepID=A0A834GNI8_RHOSS|nr:hypothetical protein RHSIM_Rhsim07G0149400 [Rhododendron simsii]